REVAGVGGGGRLRMIDLTGKSAVVTGGSRGIGRAIVLRLATQGADVAFSYKGNEAAAKDTAKEVEKLGRRVIPVKGDATDPAAAEQLVKAARSEERRVGKECRSRWWP